MPANGSSNVSTAALVLGALGSLLAVASLSWQVATFKMSGSRVKVKLLIGGLGSGATVTAPLNRRWNAKIEEFAPMGYNTPCLAIEASNVGRLAVDVVRCKAILSNGTTFEPFDYPVNPPTNYRLEHGQMKTWFIELSPLQTIVDVAALGNSPKHSQKVRLSLQLGTGKTVTTEQGVTLSPKLDSRR